MEILKCKACGNTIFVLGEKNGTIECCGNEMEREGINLYKSLAENHIPEFEYEIGKESFHIHIKDHPKTASHHIEWVIVEYSMGIIVRYFKKDEIVDIELPMELYDKLYNVYAYCNIHGLWKKEIKHYKE